MNLRTLLRAATIPASLALVAATVLPAQAEQLVINDADNPGMLADVKRMRVVHGTHFVRVRVRFDDIRRSPLTYSQGASLYIDTKRADRGPEYLFTTGLNSGTDYAFTKIDTWTDDGTRVRSCNHSLKLDWKEDLAVFRFARSCIKSPSSIRVSLRAVEEKDGKVRTDWAPKYRTFTAPVTSG